MSLSRTPMSTDKQIRSNTNFKSSGFPSSSELTKQFHDSVVLRKNQEASKKESKTMELKSGKDTAKRDENVRLTKEKTEYIEEKTPGKNNVEPKNVDEKKVETKETKAFVKDITLQSKTTTKYKMVPIIKEFNAHQPSNVAVPRKRPPLSAPILGERPLVLATHLVPSLPISLFEVLVEAIEVATEKPVVLLHEPRTDRPVAKGVTDIAILPASKNWEEGELLPVSFCFEHRLNQDNSSRVYVDVVVGTDRAAHVENITDLRGHRCSLPDRRKQIGAAALLFNYLYTRGEGPSFFGNTLDTDTQVAALQMVAGKQSEVGIVESPVIKCNKNTLPGAECLHILTSLGPLPPYRIMVNKNLPEILIRKISSYLLNIDQDKEWVERFAPFGVKSFTKNSIEFYDPGNTRSVITSVPYY